MNTYPFKFLKFIIGQELLITGYRISHINSSLKYFLKCSWRGACLFILTMSWVQLQRATMMNKFFIMAQGTCYLFIYQAPNLYFKISLFSMINHRFSFCFFFFAQRCGKCKLQKVKVRNKGLNWNSPKNVYWKNEVERFESLKIILHGNAEFEASDVTLEVWMAPI